MKVQRVVKVIAILLFAALAGCSSDDEDKAKALPQQTEAVGTVKAEAPPAPKPSIKPSVRKIPEYIPEQLEYFGKMAFEKALRLLDINHDKIIDFHDVETVLQALENKKSNKQMDINQDGEIDVIDIDLLSMLAGAGKDFSIGVLDNNFDGKVSIDDYRLDSTSVQAFSPFYDESTAKSLIRRGAHTYSADVSGSNLNFADVNDHSNWQSIIELSGFTISKANKSLSDQVKNEVMDIIISEKFVVWEMRGSKSDTSVSIFVGMERGDIHIILSDDAGRPEIVKESLLIWAGFIWEFNGDSFDLIAPINVVSVDEPVPASVNISNWLIPSAYAANRLNEISLREFMIFFATISANNKRLRNSINALGLNKKKQCEIIDCKSLKSIARVMDQLFIVKNGASTLARVAINNANKAALSSELSTRTIRKNVTSLRYAKLYQDLALWTADFAVDMIEASATGDPKALDYNAFSGLLSIARGQV